MALRVNSETFDAEVLKSTLPVIVDFYSDSCIPCKQMSAILGDLEDEYEENVKIVKVNVNFSTDLAEQYQVMAAPTLLLFKDGKEVARHTGLLKKDALIGILTPYL